MEAVSTVAIEVGDLDDAGVLALVADTERRDRAVQLDKLRLAYAWCVRHPATSDTGTATWGDAGLPGLSDCDASLGGDGSPGVAPFVAEELGAALGVPTQAAMGLMADALDLRHRLPRLWALVEAGAVAPWKTRRVAADTRSLPFEAVRWVDEQVAARVDGFGLPTIERLVALAAARFAPEEQAAREERRGSGCHVTLTHPRPGAFAGTHTSRPPGTRRTSSASTPWSARRRSIWAGSGTPTTTRPARPRPSGSSRRGRPPSTSPARRRPRSPREPVQTNLYVHVSLADIATHLGGDPRSGRSRGSAPPPST